PASDLGRRLRLGQLALALGQLRERLLGTLPRCSDPGHEQGGDRGHPGKQLRAQQLGVLGTAGEWSPPPRREPERNARGEESREHSAQLAEAEPGPEEQWKGDERVDDRRLREEYQGTHRRERCRERCRL